MDGSFYALDGERMITCDFATFCYKGDVHRLHKPGHLEMQVSSNRYPFNQVIVVYQNCEPNDYGQLDCSYPLILNPVAYSEQVKDIFSQFNIDVDKPQYQSNTDNHHTWKNHVVNHLAAALASHADYIVFADLDCWMIKQPDFANWVEIGISVLQNNPAVFIVSPNDGEPSRMTQVISQQMFLTRLDDFRQADFNQPGYTGNPRDYPEMPEYHAMLEGRISYYCKSVGRYRYVLPPEYRYWHFNRTTQDGDIETDISRY